MKKVVFVLAVAIIFASCRGHHHSQNLPSETIQPVKVDSVVKKPVKTPSVEQTFYSEVFNKQGLKFGKWKDSTQVAMDGEGGSEYNLPIKVQHGSTENFLFTFIISNEYWEENGNDYQPFIVKYRRIGTPAEGKTLAEDAANRKIYEWKDLDPLLNDSIKGLLCDVPLAKRYVHKK